MKKYKKTFMERVTNLTIEELVQINRNLHLLMEKPENEELLYTDDGEHETELAKYLDSAELVISLMLLLKLEQKRSIA